MENGPSKTQIHTHKRRGILRSSLVSVHLSLRDPRQTVGFIYTESHLNQALCLKVLFMQKWMFTHSWVMHDLGDFCFLHLNINVN